MFGKISTLLSALAFVGCAQPRYENITVENKNDTSTNQKLGECSLQFKNSGYCVFWNWETVPTNKAYGSFTFKVLRSNLLDQSPMPVDINETMAVVLWMKMGHGSAPTKVTKVDIGSYRVSNVFFTMPGEWQIKFQIKEGSSIKDEAIFTFNF